MPKFLLSLLLLVHAVAAEKFNVLFIAVDDMNTDLGCYGVEQVHSPNIDRLAAMGARFEFAYCQQPLCAPSRASMMTGLRPNTINFHTLQDDLKQLNPGLVTMGDFFQEHDYFVARVGKIYHYGNPTQIGTDGHDYPETWMERYNPAGIDKLQEENIVRYPGGVTGRKNALGISMAWWDPVSEDSDHTDGQVADIAIRLIEDHKDEPFFIAAGFYNPHCPYVAPKKYFDLYTLDEIELQDLQEARQDLVDVPHMAVQRDVGNRWPYYFGCSVEEARKCKQAYYACVSFVDAQVGRILDTLEKNGLIDNTIIVFWSDHGYFLGDKGLWYKRKNFERSLRVPMIIRVPGQPQPGVVRPQIVESTDLFPTIADYAVADIPEVDGVSLRPVLQNAQAEWDPPAISQVHHSKRNQGYSIRVPRWRYTEWNAGLAGHELYDHYEDPDEVNNLAANPDYAHIVNRLRAQLRPFTAYAPQVNYQPSIPAPASE